MQGGEDHSHSPSCSLIAKVEEHEVEGNVSVQVSDHTYLFASAAN